MRHLSGRPLTVAGGLLLGLLLAAVLLALNVMGVHIDQEAPPWSAPSAPPGAPLTGNQPELTRALLSTADLAGRRTPPPVTPAPASSRVEAAASSPPPPPAAPPVRSDRAERCHTLFSAPWELAGSGRRLTDQAGSLLRGTGGDAPALRQTLSLFTDDGAAAALDAIRTSVSDCRTFETTLDDGTLATVSLRELESTDGGYAVRITALGEGGTLTGYLAVGRVGPMLSVLRTVGPEGTVDSADAVVTLDMAIDKMALLGDLPGN